jgi:hypothetical protein
MTPRHWIEIMQSRNAKWFFHVRHSNGKITSASQLYTRKDSAIRRAKQEWPLLKMEVRRG